MNLKSLVEELGIDDLPEDQQERIFRNIFETLQLRVSLRLAQEIRPEQQKQLEEAAKHGDEAAMAELEKVYPNIGQIYQEETEKLKRDFQSFKP